MTAMIVIIIADVAFVCSVYMAYLAGKEDGYCDGRIESYRELKHIIEHYKALAHAKDTTTEGA
nr:MAG TPA: hypothetical protein [Caudoviricetes sp.]